MGILNATPDSFSDGGQFLKLSDAQFQIDQMIESGADIIDIGGESTRPGAEVVSVQNELDRVMPVIEFAKTTNIAISLDTQKTAVMAEGIKLGIDMVNDINALRDEGAVELLAKNSHVNACLMHMQGTPQTMQVDPQYHNVVTSVTDFLQQRTKLCLTKGIKEDKLLWDPGFGFGKTLTHNYQLLANLNQIVESARGVPLLVGLSRKSMFSKLLNIDTTDTLIPSVVAAALAQRAGALIFRVHDVDETKQALQILQACSTHGVV
ncbi:MAG: dihydropteroate synthase [Pseudomonadota bacterium]